MITCEGVKDKEKLWLQDISKYRNDFQIGFWAHLRLLTKLLPSAGSVLCTVLASGTLAPRSKLSRAVTKNLRNMHIIGFELRRR